MPYNNNPWANYALPPPFNQWPASDYLGFTGYMSQQPSTNTLDYYVAQYVATYPNNTIWQSYLRVADEETRAQYEAGKTIKSVVQYYPSCQSGVGLVASSLNNATAQSQGLVGMSILK